MKLNEAITRSDDLKPNDYSIDEKVEWLSRLDGRIRIEIIDNHEGAGEGEFVPYEFGRDQEAELIVPFPYDDIYIHWLHAQIDYANGEIYKYNNCMAMFNSLLQTFSDYYKRTHTPKQKGWKFF